MKTDFENRRLSSIDPVFNNRNLLSDLIHFKDSILKELKQLDTKLTYKYNTIQTLIDNKFSSYDNKFNDITSNLDSLTKSVSEDISQKDKVSKLDTFRLKTEETLLSHNYSINVLSKKLEEASDKNDKIVNSNFLYPGIIGVNCKFPTFRNYIDYTLESVGNLLSFKEKAVIEIKDNKNKTKTINYGLKSSINNMITTCNNFTSKNITQLEEKIDQKINECEEKFEEVKCEKDTFCTNSEKTIDNLKNEILKTNETYKNINIEIEKLSEINKKNEIYIKENNEKLKNINENFDKFNKEFNDLKNDYKKYKKNESFLERKKSSEESTQYAKFTKLAKTSTKEKNQTSNNFYLSSSGRLDNNSNFEQNKDKTSNSNIEQNKDKNNNSNIEQNKDNNSNVEQNKDKNNYNIEDSKNKEITDDVVVTNRTRERIYNSETKKYKLDKINQSEIGLSISTRNLNAKEGSKSKNKIINCKNKSYIFPVISGNKINNQNPKIKENKIFNFQKNDNDNIYHIDKQINDEIDRKINNEKCNNQINIDKNNNLMIITNISKLKKSNSAEELKPTKCAPKKDEILKQTKKIIKRKILMEDNEEKIFERLLKKMIEFKNSHNLNYDKNKKYAEIYNKMYEVESAGNCLNNRRESSNYYLDLMVNDDKDN